MALQVIEPATEEVLAEVQRATAEDVDAAVARAKAAFPAWRAVAPGDRARLLHRLADALDEHHEELAVLEARNAGKPIGDARGEMGMVADTFRYYAGGARAAAGRHDPGRRRPGLHRARAARRGRAHHAVELPADDRLVEAGPGAGGGQHGRAQARRADAADRAALRRAGARGRAARGRRRTSSPGPGRECGQRLVEHPDVAKIAFTGSTEVGRSIAAGAAATIKRVTLELGGKCANVVFADADLERGGGDGAAGRLRQRRARTAARARGSSSSAARWTASWRRWRRRSGRCASATRSTRRRRWAR